MDITQKWMDFVESLILYHPASAYAQERKFVEGTTLIFPSKVWNKGYSHTLPDLGYSASSKGSKMKQLMRDYYNKPSIEEAKKTIAKRGGQAVTTVGVSTLAGNKSNAQGHCIRSLTLNYFSPQHTPDKKPRLTIDIYYRTTELLRKFGADLVFLYDHLIPDIIGNNPWKIEEPDEVRLYFSSCFFSALYVPVFYKYKDPVKFLTQMETTDNTSGFYGRCIFRTKTMLERDASHYKFRSRRNMQELSDKFFEEGHINKKELEKFLRRLEN